MDLADLTAALSAGAPYSAPITAFLQLALKTETLLAPDLAQKIDDDYHNQLADWNATCEMPDGADRADRINAFLQRVLLRNGTPVVGVSGSTGVIVPLPVLFALGNDALLAERAAAIDGELTLGGKTDAK